MSKRRMNALIFLGVFVLYVIGAGISLSSSVKYENLKYNQQYSENDSAIMDYIEDIESGMCDDQSFDTMMFGMSMNFNTSYPFAIALYDENANKIAQSGSCVTCATIDGYMPIENYLTDDIKKQILEYYGTDVIYVCENKIDLSITDDGVVPVNIYLSDRSDKNDFKIHLNDLEVTNQIDTTGNDEETVTFYYYNTTFSNKISQLYNHAIELVNNKTVKDTIRGFKSSQATSTNTDGLTIRSCIMPDSKVYYIAYSTVNDDLYKAVFSFEFENLITGQTMYYFIVTVVIFIVSNKLYDKNKKLNDTKQAFTSAAAHELKTPITIINNQCECLVKNVAPEKQMQYINNIYKQNNHMSHLVSGLLHYNRLDSSKQLKKESFNLVDIAMQELDRYRALIEIKGIVVETDFEDFIINADKNLIDLAVDNFISNAVKHTQNGKKIIVSIKKNDAKYTFSVFNEGSSIKQEYEKTIWDVFNRNYDSDSDDNSTGMGLAICKKIFELHKFNYGFHNLKNGVEFYFVAS